MDCFDGPLARNKADIFVSSDGIMLTHKDVKTADPNERSFQGILLAGCQILVVVLPVVMFWIEGKSKVKQHLQASAAIGVRVVDSVTNRLSGRQMSVQAARETLARLDDDHLAQLLALRSPMLPLQVSAPSQFFFTKCCTKYFPRGFIVDCSGGSGHLIIPLSTADAG